MPTIIQSTVGTPFDFNTLKEGDPIIVWCWYRSIKQTNRGWSKKPSKRKKQLRCRWRRKIGRFISYEDFIHEKWGNCWASWGIHLYLDTPLFKGHDNRRRYSADFRDQPVYFNWAFKKYHKTKANTHKKEGFKK